MSEPIQKFHVRLLKAGIKQFRDAVIEPERLDSYRVRSSIGFPGRLFVAPAKQGAPPWLTFVQTGIAEQLKNLTNRTNAAVLVVKVSNRFLAYTFSHGWHLLREEMLVADFGLRSALNGLRHDSLRSLDSFSVEDQTVHRRAQASRASGIEAFGLDIGRDIVRAVTGTPSDDTHSRGIVALAGSESTLAVSARVNFSGLHTLSADLLRLYRSDAYREHFGWVDNVGRVRDPQLLEILDQRLVQALVAGGHSSGAYLAPPETIDFERFDGFALPGRRMARDQELGLGTYLSGLPAAELTVARLSSDKIRVFYGGATEPSVRWPIYKCLVCEVAEGDVSYVLSSGGWYRIERRFAERVRRSVGRIPVCKVKLPHLEAPGGKVESERSYNERAEGSSSSLVMLDGKTARCQLASSPIEVCDLFSAKRRLIHVKHRKGNSSVLSHLFAQGRVSAEALMSDEAFRMAVRALLRERRASWEGKVPKARPDASGFEIVYCFLGTASRQPAMELPFFSQLTLARTYENLRSRGFKVSIRGVQTR